MSVLHVMRLVHLCMLVFSQTSSLFRRVSKELFLVLRYMLSQSGSSHGFFQSPEARYEKQHVDILVHEEEVLNIFQHSAGKMLPLVVGGECRRRMWALCGSLSSQLR